MMTLAQGTTGNESAAKFALAEHLIKVTVVLLLHKKFYNLKYLINMFLCGCDLNFELHVHCMLDDC